MGGPLPQTRNLATPLIWDKLEMLQQKLTKKTLL